MALTAKKVYAILKRQISDMEAKLNSPVRYRGTVATADLLPLNPDIGDMYNIESKSIYGEAGMNVAWNGVVWDTMGAPIDMSLYFTKEEAEAVIQRLVAEYFEKNPVKPGATTEQAQQIEQNKTDVASLKEDIIDYVVNISVLNIYDKSAPDNIINYALQPNGEPIEFDSRCVTSFIKLDANTDYQMISYQNGISAICFYDDSKAVISKDGEWHDPLSVINIPSVAFRRYIRVELFNTTTFDGDSVKLVVCKKGLLDGNYHEYNEVKKEYKFGTKDIDNSANFLTKSEAKQLITNNTANFITESEAKQLITKPYKNLKWYALGDSYTEQGCYTSKIVEKTGMILTNYGVGGTRLADSDGHQTDAMCYRYLNMSDEKPDLITVMGGTNDCYYSTLGKAGDTSVSTVAGAIYVIYKGLQEKYPNTPILFATMPVRWDSRFEEYANIMIDTCEYWRIPCVDIYHNCGFNDWNKSIYNLNNDGIHVNENGGKVLAQLFIDAMNKVIY